MDSTILGVEGFELTRIDKSGLVIGLYFAGISYGVLLLQLGMYIRAKAADPVLLKLAVCFFFCCDTAWCTLLLAAAYRQLVIVEPDSLEAYIPSLTLVCIPFCTPFVVAGVNLFLIFRYKRLTGRRILCYGLYFITVITFGCHLWSTSLSIKLRNFDIENIAAYKDDWLTASTLGKAGLIMEVIMVCTTWALLLVALLGYLQQEIMGTRLVVMRLLLITLESGTAATAISVASLVYYLKHPSSSNLIVIAAFMARVYYMGMLFNLNMRGSGGQVMRDGSGSRPSQVYGDSNSLALNNIRSGNSSRYQHKVIRVTQAVDTEADKMEVPGNIFKLGDAEVHEYGRSTSEKERVHREDV